VQSNPQLLSDSAFFALRFVLAVVTLVVVFLVIRRAVHSFVGANSKQLGRKKYVAAGINGIVLALLAVLHSRISDLLLGLGQKIGQTIPAITQEWTGGFLAGLFNTLLSLLFLLLVIQLVGAVFWFFESRLTARAAMQQHKTGSPARNVYVFKTLSLINRISRTAILVFLIVAFVYEIFTFFRGMKPMVDTFNQFLGTPARTITQAVVNYLPNLGYIGVLGFAGWAMLRILKYTFRSIEDGTLHIPGFVPEWSVPTYKLLRTVILLFILMVSFPYLPGAGSQFFQGFSLFVGALVTFGSSGAIGNIVSGITLTYTNAFRVGDVICTNGITGFVREKTMLVTRIITFQNEVVTIPNGSILSTPTLNYTRRAVSKGLILTVDAGIGYDVDWRTVQRLMIEGARRTGHILSDPAPRVWQTALGDYAVTYQLRAYTDRADLMLDTHSDLRANVLDEFNRAGVEIMTPSIFAHRDASGLAIPPEQFSDPAAARVIAVEVKQSPSKADPSAQKDL
jgi:small-conductance mechanosensitive channel